MVDPQPGGPLKKKSERYVPPCLYFGVISALNIAYSAVCPPCRYSVSRRSGARDSRCVEGANIGPSHFFCVWAWVPWIMSSPLWRAKLDLQSPPRDPLRCPQHPRSHGCPGSGVEYVTSEMRCEELRLDKTSPKKW